MADYVSPVRDIQFVLQEVIGLTGLAQYPVFEDATPDIIAGVIEEAARQIDETIGPLNLLGDEQGCSLQQGEVKTPDGFKAAYDSYVSSGWLGLDKPTEFGGQGLPYGLATAVTELLSGANAAFSLYPGLSGGAFDAINALGSDEQKATFLSHLCEGDWSGTMCLTEPGAGSDLGQVRTKAIAQGEGTFLIEGSKIFITAGEHDLTDNIIHLVLARTPDAPEGIRGISMFIVPKWQLQGDGRLGPRNAVDCASIEQKMGIHGSSTCVLNFNGAQGQLIGELNHGIQNMFVMMNAARLMVGLQGLGVAERATQNAVSYAKERRQGRALIRKTESTFDAEPIIVHPDVRRMLLTMKAFTEGGRMMAYDAARYVDIGHADPDAKVQQHARDRVDLLTPICKAFLTDIGLEVSSLGIQVFGGHGYIREHGMEQNLRDSKIFCIYEGTNGIQAMDLVGRKLTMAAGRLPASLFADIEYELQQAEAKQSLVDLADALRPALATVRETTDWLIEASTESPDSVAASAYDYLQMLGLLLLGYYWLKAAQVAEESDEDGDNFYRGKKATARFYMLKLLPRIYGLAPAIRAGGDSVVQPEAEIIQ